jgi:hypothetical protein
MRGLAGLSERAFDPSSVGGVYPRARASRDPVADTFSRKGRRARLLHDLC